MMILRLRNVLIACLLLFNQQSANATLITVDATHVSGNTWIFEYTVTNDSLPFDIEEFSVYFDLALFENLVALPAPPDWDPLVIQPDIFLPDDGFYDALALVSGIIPGSTLGGFRVQFDYLGGGTPFAQAWDVFDPFTFDILDSGFTPLITLVAPNNPLPEPSSMSLVAGSLLLMALAKRRRKSRRL